MKFLKKYLRYKKNKRIEKEIKKERNFFIGERYVDLYKLNIRKSDESEIVIGDGFSIRNHIIFNVNEKGKLILGNNIFINDGVKINVRDKVVIGNETIIGQNVLIYDHDHNYRNRDYKNSFVTEPVIIGKNVWIGSGVIILKGVKIGDNSVIAAGSVLTHDIGANTLYYEKRKCVIKEIMKN